MAVVVVNISKAVQKLVVVVGAVGSNFRRGSSSNISKGSRCGGNSNSKY